MILKEVDLKLITPHPPWEDAFIFKYLKYQLRKVIFIVQEIEYDILWDIGPEKIQVFQTYRLASTLWLPNKWLK